MSTYEWKNVTFSYPSAWELREVPPPNEHSQFLQVIAQTSPRVSVSVNLTKDPQMTGSGQISISNV